MKNSAILLSVLVLCHFNGFDWKCEEPLPAYFNCWLALDTMVCSDQPVKLKLS